MNRYPAIVRSVNRARREVRVEIPGQTDGASIFPLAEIEYPIGDRSEHTEIRILEGDRVWVAFINGDPRYPIITGFRAKHLDNEVGTRHIEHDTIDLVADEEAKLSAGAKIELAVGAAKIEITAAEIRIEVAGSVIVLNAAGITINGTRIDLNP